MTATDSASLAHIDIVGPLIADATGDPGWKDATADLVAGGKSNLTYLLNSSAGELVLRRPPNGSILPTAHDMRREARIQQALAGSAVPVAEIVLVDDGRAIGVPFYVMAKVPGGVIRSTLPDGFTVDHCRTAGHAVADTLADLHRVDSDAVGLSDYGRPEGFVERQLSRWSRQWEASRPDPDPAVDELATQLRRRVPTTRFVGIVHGDYRLDNCVVDLGTGRIAAVLDWELSTLGDPLTDLGMLVFYWRDAGRVTPSLVPAVTHLPGFPTADDVVERWVARTGIEADDIGWYHAFAAFKLAAIAGGIRRRVLNGAMGGQQFGDLSRDISATAESGLDVLAAWSGAER